jgi:hypothetical protein
MSTSLNYLIPYVRLKIGDTNPDTYRYLDEWLLTSLVMATKQLHNYWSFKYLLDESFIVTRNVNSYKFTIDEPPTIEPTDEMIIVILSSIIVLEGSLESSAWDAISWRDNEISFSNLERYRTRSEVLRQLVNELNSLILPPTKRLARTKKLSLPGYLNNSHERDTEY